jgi:hypothetical protein
MTQQQRGQESAATIKQQIAELEKASPRDQAAIDEAKRRLAEAEQRERQGGQGQGSQR